MTLGCPPMADDCIFCKIVAGELPSEIVQEDEHTLAFMDLNPWTRGHALVIPRNHSKNLYEAPEEDLAHASAAASGWRYDARAPALRRREPAQLLRAGRLADRVPPAPARDPALRRRPAPAAGAAAAGGGRRAGRGCAESVQRARRLERDGDLGVLVLDDPPLNLFGAEMVRDILTCLDEADGVGPARARRGRVLHGRCRRERLRGFSEHEAKRLVAGLMAITHRVEELPFPTLASVHGLASPPGSSWRWPAT